MKQYHKFCYAANIFLLYNIYCVQSFYDICVRKGLDDLIEVDQDNTLIFNLEHSRTVGT